jgi:hypothetical protein
MLPKLCNSRVTYIAEIIVPKASAQGHSAVPLNAELSPDGSALWPGWVLDFKKARGGLQAVKLDRIRGSQPCPPELEKLIYSFVGHYYVANLNYRSSTSGGLAAFIEVHNGLSQRIVITPNLEPFVRVSIKAVNGDHNCVQPPAQDFPMWVQLK